MPVVTVHIVPNVTVTNSFQCNSGRNTSAHASHVSQRIVERVDDASKIIMISPCGPTFMLAAEGVPLPAG